MNKVILIGRLGKDPELKEGKDYKLCKFSLATSKKWKNKQGEQQEETQWHNILASNALAGLCSTYLSKGDKVALEGEITYREHEGKYYTTIRAYGVEFLGNPGDRDLRTENEPEQNSIQSGDLPF